LRLVFEDVLQVGGGLLNVLGDLREDREVLNEHLKEGHFSLKQLDELLTKVVLHHVAALGATEAADLVDHFLEGIHVATDVGLDVLAGAAVEVFDELRLHHLTDVFEILQVHFVLGVHYSLHLLSLLVFQESDLEENLVNLVIIEPLLVNLQELVSALAQLSSHVFQAFRLGTYGLIGRDWSGLLAALGYVVSDLISFIELCRLLDRLTRS